MKGICASALVGDGRVVDLHSTRRDVCIIVKTDSISQNTVAITWIRRAFGA
jgi:hypothetical protein